MRHRIWNWLWGWNEAGYEAVNIYGEKPHWKSRLARRVLLNSTIYYWLRGE